MLPINLWNCGFFYITVWQEVPVEKYTLKVDNGNIQIEETVEIDTEKETETFEIPDDGDTSPSAPGDVESVYDFKQVKISERGIDCLHLWAFPYLSPSFSLTKRFLCACFPIILQYLHHYSPLSYACRHR